MLSHIARKGKRKSISREEINVKCLFYQSFRGILDQKVEEENHFVQ